MKLTWLNSHSQMCFTDLILSGLFKLRLFNGYMADDVVLTSFCLLQGIDLFLLSLRYFILYNVTLYIKCLLFLVFLVATTTIFLLCFFFFKKKSKKIASFRWVKKTLSICTRISFLVATYIFVISTIQIFKLQMKMIFKS